jgi:hypothetical protein
MTSWPAALLILLFVIVALTIDALSTLIEICGRPDTALELPPETSLLLNSSVCCAVFAESVCIEKPGSAFSGKKLLTTVALIADDPSPRSRRPALNFEPENVDASTLSVVVPATVFSMCALESSDPDTVVRRIWGVPVTLR